MIAWVDFMQSAEGIKRKDGGFLKRRFYIRTLT